MLSARSLILSAVFAVSATAQVTIVAGGGVFNDISVTGTALLGASDDTAHGFTSTVGNELFPAGQIVVTSNGYIVSGAAPGGSVFFNGAIGAATDATAVGYTAGRPVLCPFWDDLYATGFANTTIYWQEISGVLYIQWQNIGHYATAGGPLGPAITFQVQIFGSGSCTPSVINYVYPDTTFGGVQAANDNGASATVGYIGAAVGDNNQYSFNVVASIPNGTSLTVSKPGTQFGHLWTSPLGPGSLQLNICNGTVLGQYQLLATLNAGLFPNGWLYGIDITYPELLGQIGAFPFLGLLDGSGAAQLGPFTGLPPITLYTLVFNMPAGLPANHSTALSYTIP